MSDTDTAGARADTNQLGVLALLWYALGVLYLLGGCAGVFSTLLGGSVSVLDPDDPGLQQGAAMWARTFGCLSLSILLAAFLNMAVGRSLTHARNRTLITVMSVLNLVSFPFGTALGVFTLVILGRPPVRARFARTHA